MSKSDKTDRAAGGLMSSAGLATYYDAEDESFAFDPRSVLLFGILAAILLSGVNLLLI